MNRSASRKYWFQRHPWLTRAAISLVSLAGVLLGAEGVARLLRPQWAPTQADRMFWKYHPTLGWAHQPGQSGQLNHRDFSVQVRINSRGLRDREYELPRTNKKRMLVLGDSFAWGFGVEEHERFSEILEDRHVGWDIINSGVSGYGTDQCYLYLRDEGLSYRPDLVLLLFYINDIIDNGSPQRYWHYKPYFELIEGQLELKNTPVPTPALRQRIDRFLLGKTYLYARLYARVVRPARSTKVWQTNDLELTWALLRAMNHLCRDSGAVLTVISAPMKRAPAVPQLMRQTCSREQIPFLALDHAFSDQSSATTLPHDHHWNPLGHKVAAEAMEAFLEQEGLLEQTAKTQVSTSINQQTSITAN